jgi:hypothetical protein
MYFGYQIARNRIRATKHCQPRRPATVTPGDSQSGLVARPPLRVPMRAILPRTDGTGARLYVGGKPIYAPRSFSPEAEKLVFPLLADQEQ